MDNQSYKILIMDDQKLLAISLKALISTIFPNAEINTCITKAEAEAQLNIMKYDFFFTDIVFSNKEEHMSIQYIEDCCKKYPGLYIVVISSVKHFKVVQDFLKSGIRGYVSKAIDHMELALALKQILEGSTYISSDIISKLATHLADTKSNELTRREMEILRLIAKGYMVKKIAEELFLSQYTVMNHRQNLMKKLKLHTAPELVKYAYENYIYI